jgi:hypothetical protein
MTHKVHITAGLVNGGHTAVIILPMYNQPDKRRMIFSNLDYQLMMELFDAKTQLSVAYLRRQYQDILSYYGVAGRLLYLLDRRVIELVTKTGDRINVSDSGDPYIKLSPKGRFICRRYFKDFPYYELHGST